MLARRPRRRRARLEDGGTAPRVCPESPVEASASGASCARGLGQQASVRLEVWGGGGRGRFSAIPGSDKRAALRPAEATLVYNDPKV